MNSDVARRVGKILILTLVAGLIFLSLWKFGSVIGFFLLYAWAIHKVAGFGLNPHLANITAILIALALYGIIYLVVYRRHRAWGIGCLLFLLVAQSLCMFAIEKDHFFSITNGQPIRFYTINPINHQIQVFDQPVYDLFGQKALPVDFQTAQEIYKQQHSDQFQNLEIPFGKIQNFFDRRTGKPIVWYCTDDTGYHFFPCDGFDPGSGKTLLPVTTSVIEFVMQQLEDSKRLKTKVNFTIFVRDADGEPYFGSALITLRCENRKKAYDCFTRDGQFCFTTDWVGMRDIAIKTANEVTPWFELMVEKGGESIQYRLKKTTNTKYSVVFVDSASRVLPGPVEMITTDQKGQITSGKLEAASGLLRDISYGNNKTKLVFPGKTETPWVLYHVSKKDDCVVIKCSDDLSSFDVSVLSAQKKEKSAQTYDISTAGIIWIVIGCFVFVGIIAVVTSYLSYAKYNRPTSERSAPETVKLSAPVMNSYPCQLDEERQRFDVDMESIKRGGVPVYGSYTDQQKVYELNLELVKRGRFIDTSGIGFTNEAYRYGIDNELVRRGHVVNTKSYINTKYRYDLEKEMIRRGHSIR